MQYCAPRVGPDHFGNSEISRGDQKLPKRHNPNLPSIMFIMEPPKQSLPAPHNPYNPSHGKSSVGDITLNSGKIDHMMCQVEEHEIDKMTPL